VVSTFVDASDTALYLQDMWRPSTRVTVTLGGRADIIRRRDRLFDVMTERTTDVSRRIGVTVAADHAAHRVLYGNWSRIYDNLSQNAIQAGTNVTGVTDVYDSDLDGNFETVFVTPARLARSSNVLLDLAHLHQPRADEFLGGFRQQVRGGLAIDVSAIRRAYGRPTALEVNGVYDGNVFRGYTDETQNEIYRITDNIWNWPVVTALEAAVSRTGPRFDVLASVSREWNRLHGTWQPNDPAGRLQPGAFADAGGIGAVNGCTGGGFLCPDADGFSSLPGSGTWRSYVGNGAATVRGPRHFEAGLSVTWQAGPWSGPVLTRLAAADPAFGPATVTLTNGRQVSNPLATPIRFKYPTRGEGQLRLPALVLGSLHVTHTLAIGRCQLASAVDVLNITNHAADQAFQVGAQQDFSPLFGQSMLRQFPRSLLVSTRLTF
jgi:hypothetical protein